jgi:NAD(P) transhydrogenase subunit alpha
MIPEDVLLLLNNLTIFTLAILVGFAVISKVPATLHTPLMSGANSIHGIVLVGAMLIAAEVNDLPGYILALVAVAFATMNVVGGYVVTGCSRCSRRSPWRPNPSTRPSARRRRRSWTRLASSKSWSASRG